MKHNAQNHLEDYKYSLTNPKTAPRKRWQKMEAVSLGLLFLQSN